MKKSLFLFIINLLFSVLASLASVILVRWPPGCHGDICYDDRLSGGLPFNIYRGPFDPNIMFVANTVFYFLVFLGIYFICLVLTGKKKKK